MSAREEILLAEAGHLYKNYCLSANNASIKSRHKRQQHGVTPNQPDSWAQELIRRDPATLTFKDRIASHALLINQEPNRNLHSVEELLKLVDGKSKRESLIAVETLAGLWMQPLLPSKRKLKKLDFEAVEQLKRKLQPPSANNGGQQNIVEKKIADMYFEHRLKEHFNAYTTALQRYLQDAQVEIRRKSLRIVNEILQNKPEQEQQLLTLLVNKLGDADRKLASNAMFYLTRLATHHPMTMPFIVDEVAHFVFRPNLPLRAQYYAVCFLNSLEPLLKVHSTDSSNNATDAASVKVLDIFYSLLKNVFTMLMGNEKGATVAEKKKPVKKMRHRNIARGDAVPKPAAAEASTAAGEEELSRFFSLLVSGINKTFATVPPQSRAKTVERLMEHSDELFKLVHTCRSFPATMQILSLLQQLSSPTADRDEGAEEGIYVDDKDDDEQRNSASFPLRSRFYAVLYRKLADPEVLEHQSSQGTKLLLHILYKSLLHDSSPERMRAILKRMLQLALAAAPHFACALLVVADEALRNHAKRAAVLHLKPMPAPSATANAAPSSVRKRTTRSTTTAIEDDDADEIYSDILDDNDEKPVENVEDDDDNDRSVVKPSWLHVANQKILAKRKSALPSSKNQQLSPPIKPSTAHDAATTLCSAYNFHARNPQFAGAQFDTFWELALLTQHAHPSVAIMARKLSTTGTSINYSGNPLDDFATIKFLDRFVNRNVKKKDRDASNNKNNKADKRSRVAALDINSVEYSRLPASQVPPEESFMHTFARLHASSRGAAAQKTAREQAGKKDADADADDDVDSVGDDEFDAYLARFERQQGDMYDDKDEQKKKNVDDEDDDELDVDFSEAMKQAGLETVPMKVDDEDENDGDEEDGDDAKAADDDDDELLSVESDTDGDNDDDGDAEGRSSGKSHKKPHLFKKRGSRGAGRRKR